jgi:hypothetical protein
MVIFTQFRRSCVHTRASDVQDAEFLPEWGTDADGLFAPPLLDDLARCCVRSLGIVSAGPPPITAAFHAAVRQHRRRQSHVLC